MYAFTVIPKNAAGGFLVTPAAGFFTNLRVQLPTGQAMAAGSLAIVQARVNNLSASSLDPITIFDREQAPDAKLVITGRIAGVDRVRAAAFSVDNGATHTVFPYDASTGEFTAEVPLVENRDHRLLFRLDLGDSIAVRKLDSRLEVLRFIDKTGVQRIRGLLDTLRDAYLQADRAKLFSIIDRDYIFSEPGFRDYQKFENTMRDQFTNTTTSFARWNSDDIEVVTPGRRLNVTFQWTQTVTSSRTGKTRAIASRAVRLDLRKVNGQWVIHQDLDRKLFINDYGLIPGPPE